MIKMEEILRKVKQDHALEYNTDFKGIAGCLIEWDVDEIAEKVAREAIRQSLEMAANEAEIGEYPNYYGGEKTYSKKYVDKRENVTYKVRKQSILNIQNKVV